jgi:hypothetical protein
MGQLFAAIRKLVADDKYVVGKHAAERLEERGIMEWQVVAGIDDGEPSIAAERRIGSVLTVSRLAAAG